MSIASPPARSATAFVCQMRLVATTASRWTATTLIGARPSGDAEQLGGVAQRLDLGRGLLLPGLELAPVAVHPDDRDLQLDARLDVGFVAAGDVDPLLLLVLQPARALLEVGRVGLVAAHLLGRHDEVEVDPEVTAGRAEQLVVDVGD